MSVAVFPSDSAAEIKHEKCGHPITLDNHFISRMVKHEMILTIPCCK